ncbi:MAG: ATP-binding protein [Elusimicrobia bacterium]|nr:ATP-binding protein [Elusimicrobiota bacterium]
MTRDLFQTRREPCAHNLLNLWALEDGALVGVDLQYTKLFRLTCPDALFASEAELEQHAVALGRLLDGLPENCTAQLIVRVRWDAGSKIEEYASYERPEGDMLRFIVGARVDFLRKLPFKRVEHFLALSTYAEKTDLMKLGLRPLALKVPDLGRELAGLHERRIEGLRKVCATASAALRDAKVAALPLSEAESLAFLYGRLNPALAQHTPPPPLRKSATLRSQLALNAWDCGFDTLTVDGHHHRAVNLVVRPGGLDGRAMAALADQVPGDFDLVIAVHSLSQEKAQREVEWNSTSAAVIGGLSMFTRYHEADLKCEDADALLAHVKSSCQKLYLMSCHLVLRDVDLKALTRSTDQAIQALRRLDDAVGVVDDMNHLPLFLASLPGHSHLNPRAHLVHTEAAARFLTMSSGWDGCPWPQFMTPGDDGKALGIDLFSPELTAKHSLILGVSGEGKSVLTNSLLTSFFSADESHNVIVIDDGGSYRRLCGLLGGQYLEPTLDGTYAFNPFLAREYAFDEAGRLDADFLSFMTLLVQLMVHKADLSNNQKSIIQRCVLAAYESGKSRTPILADLREAFRAFRGDEEDEALARSFYKDLDLWTEGTYGRLLNRPGTFDAASRFIVFDLNKMTQEDLKPVLLLIIKSVIHPKLADKSLRKVIALDEVWKFLREKAGADLAAEWYKTGRRFNAAVMVVTQSAEDLLASKAAEAITHNSTVKWILNLGGGYEKLADLKLSAEEIEAVKSLGKNVDRSRFRKVFLRFGERKAVIRNQLSPTEYWLYTTDPNDVNREAALREAHPEWGAVELLRALAGGARA